MYIYTYVPSSPANCALVSSAIQNPKRNGARESRQLVLLVTRMGVKGR